MPPATRAPVVADTAPAREVRRVLLRLQGLRDRTKASSAAAVTALIRRLGYVQVDSINVIERAHHLILGTRLTGYRPAHLAAGLERRRTLFEHWTHDACVIPIGWYPHWKHRFRRYAERDPLNAWWSERFGGRPEPLLRSVLERVRNEGPLRARDFEAADRRGGQGWWEWHPEKAALEHLWRTGQLAIAGRERFEKIYDLPDRVYGEVHAGSESDPAEHVAWACREAIARIGVGTPREIAQFFRAVPLDAVVAWCAAAVRSGELVPLAVVPEGGGKPVRCLARPDWRRYAGESAREDSLVALCPFDPVVRERSRTERLFGFTLRFEAFTPKAKRLFGYYVMPLLEGDRLIGRIDPKLDRERGELTVRGPWWEPSVVATKALRRRLDAALDRLAVQVAAERWRMETSG